MKYDLIMAIEVLEHVRYPQKLLETITAVLAESGVVLLGSFPFNPTNARGDHLIEAVSKRAELLSWIRSRWKKINMPRVGNTFELRS
jgi:cyclopropane fatty-acyl-phospholipid synthase-like methyltransferase